MNLAFLLHIYQPPTQSAKTLKSIAESCYLPLIRAIKNNSDIKITLNLPLSLAYQLHTNGYKDLLADLKTLYEEERIEFTTSGAYHPLLTKLPEKLVEKELILNEYGLGYYFGQDKGFEGEDALLLKNVSGVFPPEMAVNDAVVKKLDELGYSWVAVDEVALKEEEINNEKGHNVFAYNDSDLKLVARNTSLSNMLSFKRDINTYDFINEVLRLRQDGKDALVALDGEFFGHHFEDGIFLFTKLMEKLIELEVKVVTVSELVIAADSTKVTNVIESTWGESREAQDAGNVYPMWQVEGNQVQSLLWSIFEKVSAFASDIPLNDVSKLEEAEVLETFPLWDLKALEAIQDLPLKNQLLSEALSLQSLNSDQFWWTSGVEIGGVKQYDTVFINAALDLYSQVAAVSEDKVLQDFVSKTSDKIKALL